jgi:hypothetical protein
MQYIVVLERTAINPPTIRYLLRANVPLARQPYYANAEFVSAYLDTPQADLTALRAGQVVERVDSVNVGNSTAAEMQTALIEAQVAFQAAVNSQAANQWKYYGTSWDGTTWTVTGVN